jgi:methylated-DNA-[protein]-cysteine S-methyltransferase
MKTSGIFNANDISNEIYTAEIECSFGHLCVGSSDKGLKFIKLVKEIKPTFHPNHITNEVVSQLKSYFDGHLREFDITFDLEGYTDFSMRVWQQLLNIPFGTTISYMQLAINLGDAKCIRAAGTANGRNPIPIIIPCHRVIGSDGSLTGFGLGLDFKLGLLKLENPLKYNVKQGLLLL